MKKNDIEQRRAIVAEYYLNGYSTREIAKALFDMGIFNESTKEPFHHDSIAEDIKVIKAEWKDKSYSDLDAIKVEHLEILNQIRKLALQKGDLKTALSSVIQEGKIHGLESPTKTENVHSFTPDAKKELMDKLNALKGATVSTVN